MVAEEDRKLMEGVRDGDRAALQSLMERYWTTLVAYAAAHTNSRDDAEDVVQETFVRLWRHRARWTASGTVNAYLYRITRNLASNLRRDRLAQSSRDERGGVAAFGSGSFPTPEEKFESGALTADVERAIAALPARRREVFVLCRFHGLSHQAVAETLGLSTQTVSNHMSAALSDLRAALAEHIREHMRESPDSR